MWVSCVSCNINDELNSPKNCIGVQHESTFTSFPFSLWCRNLTEVLSRAAMLLALYKVLVYSDWSSWKKKAMRGCTRSVGHQSAEPAAVWWGTGDQALAPFPCGRLENWGGRIWLWSHSLRKRVRSAPPLGMCLPLSIFNKSCIPTEALSWAVFVAQPWVILHVSLALGTFGLRFNTLLYINNPVML